MIYQGNFESLDPRMGKFEMGNLIQTGFVSLTFEQVEVGPLTEAQLDVSFASTGADRVNLATIVTPADPGKLWLQRSRS
jgi:hypothetical protein